MPSLLLQTFQPMLGPWGTAGLAVLFTLSGVVNIWQLWKGKDASRWKTAADAGESTAAIYKSELEIVRVRADRIEEENRAHVKTIAELRLQRDLTPLQEQAEKFQQQTQAIQEQMVKRLEALTERNEEKAAVIVQNTDAIQNLERNISSLFNGLTATLQSIDQRLASAAAVTAT